MSGFARGIIIRVATSATTRMLAPAQVFAALFDSSSNLK